MTIAPRPNVHRSHWIGWAILLLLSEKPTQELGTSMFEPRLRAAGWGGYGLGNRTQQTRRALAKLEASGMVKAYRYLNAEIDWAITDRGIIFVADFLADNPHVTPEASREAYPDPIYGKSHAR